MIRFLLSIFLSVFAIHANAADQQGNDNPGLIMETSSGSLQVVSAKTHAVLGHIEGFADLSGAQIVSSSDGHQVFILTRAGGVFKIDMMTNKVVARTAGAAKPTGGAISNDGRLIAISSNTPAGVRIFRTDTLEPVVDIPTLYNMMGELYGQPSPPSRTAGLAAAGGAKFVVSLYDAGEIWIIDCKKCLAGRHPRIGRMVNIGKKPFFGNSVGKARFYIAGLYGKGDMALADLHKKWPRAQRIKGRYPKNTEKPASSFVPKQQRWAETGGRLLFPAAGHRPELAVLDLDSLEFIDPVLLAARPLLVVAQPHVPVVWVVVGDGGTNKVQIVDSQKRTVIHTLVPDALVADMAFTQNGKNVWISLPDENRVDIFDSGSFKRVGTLKVEKPGGIFFPSRASQ